MIRLFLLLHAISVLSYCSSSDDDKSLLPRSKTNQFRSQSAPKRSLSGSVPADLGVTQVFMQKVGKVQQAREERPLTGASSKKRQSELQEKDNQGMGLIRELKNAKVVRSSRHQEHAMQSLKVVGNAESFFETEEPFALEEQDDVANDNNKDSAFVYTVKNNKDNSLLARSDPFGKNVSNGLGVSRGLESSDETLLVGETSNFNSHHSGSSQEDKKPTIHRSTSHRSLKKLAEKDLAEDSVGRKKGEK